MAKKPAKNDQTQNKRAEDLLATALELFARRDVSSVTIKDIARDLRINAALIYYYFDSKDDLFRATLEYCIQKTMATFRGLEQKHSDPVKMISAWFDTHARLTSEIRQLVKIMLNYRTSGSPSKIADAAIKNFYEQESRILSSRIRLGIAKGIFADVNVRRSAQIASTYLDGIMVRSLIHPDFDVPAAIQDLERVFWNHLGYKPAGGRKKSAR